MRKVAIIFIITMFVLISLGVAWCIFGSLYELKNSKYFTLNVTQFRAYDNRENDFADPKSLLNQLDNTLEQILAYLHAPKKKRIMVEFGSIGMQATGVGNDSYPRLVLGPSGFKRKDCFRLARALSEMHAPNVYFSLKEGLADYIQDKFDVNHSDTALDYPIHSVAKLFLPYCTDEMLNRVVEGGKGLTYYPESKEALNYYIMCHSFVQYLIDSYGIDKFMAMYNIQTHLAYEDVFGKSARELRTDWLAVVKTQQPVDMVEYRGKEALRLGRMFQMILTETERNDIFATLHNLPGSGTIEEMQKLTQRVGGIK